MAQAIFAGAERLTARQQLDQRRLPRAVDAHQRDAVAALDDKIDAAENELLAVALGYVLKLGHDAPAGLGLRKRKMNGLLFLGQLDALDLFELLDAALDLLGFGGLSTEAIDESLQLLDAVPLVAISGFELFAALLLLLQVLFVIAGIEMHAAIPDLDDFVDCDVQEIAVMRNQHNRVRVIGQVLLQPIAGFQIQVIGGFIQQQQVRLFEQQLGQSDAHLPAAGKLLGALVPFLVRKPEPGDHRPHLRLDGVAVAITKFTIQVMEAVGHLRVLDAGGIQLRHFARELFHLDFHLLQRREYGHAFGEDSSAGEREPVLRQVAGANAARDAELSVVQRFQAGQHFEQRRFTGAVRAHQAGAVLGRDHPVEIFKQELLAEALAGAGELDHLRSIFAFAHGLPKLHNGSPTMMFIQLRIGIER